MVFITDCPRRVSIIEKPKSSIFQNENLSYVQPTKRRPMVCHRPYTKPTRKIESETTYGLSYMKFDCIPKMRTSYGKYEKMLTDKPGKIDFDTVYKSSYHPSAGKVRRAFVPRSCLSINGIHEMTTTHKLSYVKPGFVKTISYKPYRGKLEQPITMDYRSVMKESYQDFGAPIEIKRPRKREFWQTKFKADYHTTNQMSYQYVEPLRKKVRVPYRPPISAQIEKDTVYSTSYQIPGRFVTKETPFSR